MSTGILTDKLLAPRGRPTSVKASYNHSRSESDIDNPLITVPPESQS